MCWKYIKNIKFLSLWDVFFQALNAPKLVFSWGRAPDPAGWGSLRCSSQPIVGCVILPIPSPLDPFGISISAPTVPRFLGPSKQNFWIRL